MPGVTRIYTFSFTPPSDPVQLAVAIAQAGEHVMGHNKHVLKVDTVKSGDDMMIRMTVHGHDQWWIKKHIVYPLAGILTKVGIKVKDVKLVEVDKPPDARAIKLRHVDQPDKMLSHDGPVGWPTTRYGPRWYSKHPSGYGKPRKRPPRSNESQGPHIVDA